MSSLDRRWDQSCQWRRGDSFERIIRPILGDESVTESLAERANWKVNPGDWFALRGLGNLLEPDL